jgi:hypothetical protein
MRSIACSTENNMADSEYEDALKEAALNPKSASNPHTSATAHDLKQLADLADREAAKKVQGLGVRLFAIRPGTAGF